HPHVAFFRLPPPHTAHHSPSLHDALPILTINDVREMAPDRLILSPGPCTPDEAGICNDLIPEFRGVIPILGVCLGHQCIGATHRSEEHTSELQSRENLVCRLLLEKKKNTI